MRAIALLKLMKIGEAAQDCDDVAASAHAIEDLNILNIAYQTMARTNRGV